MRISKHFGELQIMSGPGKSVNERIREMFMLHISFTTCQVCVPLNDKEKHVAIWLEMLWKSTFSLRTSRSKYLASLNVYFNTHSS